MIRRIVQHKHLHILILTFRSVTHIKQRAKALLRKRNGVLAYKGHISEGCLKHCNVQLI